MAYGEHLCQLLGGTMKKFRAFACRVFAAALLGAGAFLLVAVWLQVINPLQAWHEEPHGVTWYVVGTFLAVALLAVAWCLNLRCIHASEREKTESTVAGQ